MGAVGGGAEGLGAGAEEYWLGNLGLKGPLVSISDNKSVRESSCLSKLVCFATSLWQRNTEGGSSHKKAHLFLHRSDHNEAKDDEGG